MAKCAVCGENRCSETWQVCYSCRQKLGVLGKWETWPEWLRALANHEKQERRQDKEEATWGAEARARLAQEILSKQNAEALADEYDVSPRAIRFVVNGEHWRALRRLDW